MSRAVDLLTSKLPAPQKPLSQRLRERLPFPTHIPLHASLTYLFGICLFSISFLVFLNSSLSFVITDLFGVQDGVGSIVGTLGFIDELVAIFTVVFWGALSDKIGTRLVAVSGYFLVGLSLVAFVHVNTVYPGLILARILFSIGASATVVSVTAVLPEISTPPPDHSQEFTVERGHSRQDSNGYFSSPRRASDSVAPPPLRRDRATSSNRSTVAGSSASTASTASTVVLPTPPSRPITPSRPLRRRPGSRSQQRKVTKKPPSPITGKLSGLVGFTTGCGALVALIFFLPLPAKFAENPNMTRTEAIRHTFYVVALVSWVVAFAVFIGLRGRGVGGTTWKFWKIKKFAELWRSSKKGKHSARSNANQDVEGVLEEEPNEASTLLPPATSLDKADTPSGGPSEGHNITNKGIAHADNSEASSSVDVDRSWQGLINAYFKGLWLALNAGREDWRIGLGYLGGFVARSMSVGISLFIPLYVNQWMRARGMCPPVLPSDPHYKKSCREAYILAAMLTGTSQVFALIFAPIVGYFSDRYEPQYPLMATAVLGFVSCAAFSALQSLSVGADRSWAFVHCALMGIGQIGAIVSSLALIGSAVQKGPQPASLQALGARVSEHRRTLSESTSMSRPPQSHQKPNRLAVKGSISGVYSLCGAAGILLLTQFGGWGADHANSGFAFDLLAVFFAIEIAVGCWLIFKAKTSSL